MVHSFTACMPLLTATSAFWSGRRCWSSPQQCYLYCLRTLWDCSKPSALWLLPRQTRLLIAEQSWKCTMTVRSFSAIALQAPTHSRRQTWCCAACSSSPACGRRVYAAAHCTCQSSSQAPPSLDQSHAALRTTDPRLLLLHQHLTTVHAKQHKQRAI